MDGSDFLVGVNQDQTLHASSPYTQQIMVSVEAGHCVTPMLMENKSKEGKKLKASRSHPPYREMIAEAICGVKESNGCSHQAITRFIEVKYGPYLQRNFKKILSAQLKKLTEAGELTKIKNSFKFNRRPYNKSQRKIVGKISEAGKYKLPKKAAAAKKCPLGR